MRLFLGCVFVSFIVGARLLLKCVYDLSAGAVDREKGCCTAFKQYAFRKNVFFPSSIK